LLIGLVFFQLLKKLKIPTQV